MFKWMYKPKKGEFKRGDMVIDKATGTTYVVVDNLDAQYMVKGKDWSEHFYLKSKRELKRIG